MEPAMSCDTTLTDEDGNRYSFDNLATQKWLDGHAQGARIACNRLRDKAAEMFRAERHREAVEIQNLATSIEATLIPELEKQAAVHKNTHPYELKTDEAKFIVGNDVRAKETAASTNGYRVHKSLPMRVVEIDDATGSVKCQWMLTMRRHRVEDGWFLARDLVHAPKSVDDELRTYVVGELERYDVKAIGLSPDAAIRAFVHSKGWGTVSKIEELSDSQPDDQFTWARRFTAGGTSFKAAGHEIPGGFTLTWWK
jgi:hypothetical protein